MKKISFWNMKGGVGKTTLTLNCAGALVRHGHSVLVVDKDKQGSSHSFKNNVPFDIGTTPAQSGYDYMLTDYPANADGRSIDRCDLVIVPVSPNRMEIRAMSAGLATLAKDQPFVIVANRVIPQSSDHQQFVELLRRSNFKVFVVYDRIEFQKSMNTLKTLFEYNKASYMSKESIDQIVQYFA